MIRHLSQTTLMARPPTSSSNNKLRKKLIQQGEVLGLSTKEADCGEHQRAFNALVEQVLDNSSLHLGPRSFGWLSTTGRSLFLRRLRYTELLTDGVLGAVYDGRTYVEDLELADQLRNEFWGHISHLLRQMAGRSSGPEDQIDLIQSAITSILGEAPRLDFRTQTQFLSYLMTRIKWKASNKSNRRRDKFLLDQEAAAQVVDDTAGPATKAALNSLHGRARARLAQLDQRSQYLITARLQNVSAEDQALHLGISLEACRKASQRAWKRILEALSHESDN